MLSRLKNCEIFATFSARSMLICHPITLKIIVSVTRWRMNNPFVHQSGHVRTSHAFKCSEVICIVQRELFTFDGWSQDRTALWFDSASSNPNLCAQQKSEKFHIFMFNRKLSIRKITQQSLNHISFFSMERLIYQNFSAASASLLMAFRFLIISKQLWTSTGWSLNSSWWITTKHRTISQIELFWSR